MNVDVGYDEFAQDEFVRQLASKLGYKTGRVGSPENWHECDACAIKPGSPQLCRTCIIRRDAYFKGWEEGREVYGRKGLDIGPVTIVSADRPE